MTAGQERIEATEEHLDRARAAFAWWEPKKGDDVWVSTNRRGQPGLWPLSFESQPKVSYWYMFRVVMIADGCLFCVAADGPYQDREQWAAPFEPGRVLPRGPFEDSR